MAQKSVTRGPVALTQDEGRGPGKGARLGPILCWAVVFADIGTSVYYVPGIFIRQWAAWQAFLFF